MLVAASYVDPLLSHLLVALRGCAAPWSAPLWQPTMGQKNYYTLTSLSCSGSPHLLTLMYWLTDFIVSAPALAGCAACTTLTYSHVLAD